MVERLVQIGQCRDRAHPPAEERRLAHDGEPFGGGLFERGEGILTRSRPVQHRLGRRAVGAPQRRHRRVEGAGHLGQHRRRHQSGPAQRTARGEGRDQQRHRAADHRVQPAVDALAEVGGQGGDEDRLHRRPGSSSAGPAPSRVAIDMARAQTTATCHTPVPKSHTQRSPTATPTATPIATSIPRRSRCAEGEPEGDHGRHGREDRLYVAGQLSGDQPRQRRRHRALDDQERAPPPAFGPPERGRPAEPERAPAEVEGAQLHLLHREGRRFHAAILLTPAELPNPP